MVGCALCLFVLTLVLCLSTYVLYPLVIWVAGKVAPFKPHKADRQPTVSILIAAFNEARHIGQKFASVRELDYPKDKLEVLVGSDGSTDGTAQIVRSLNDPGLRFVDFPTNRGKTAVQNDLVALSTGEVLVFTDAACFFDKDAVRKLVRSLADSRVGCVAGRMRYVGTDRNLTAQSQGLYWKYESKIREWESRLGRVLGVDGPLYAMRRDCYVPLRPDAISDFLSPLLVLQNGKQVVLEPEAVVDEEVTVSSSQELKTRRRITLRAVTGLARHSHLLSFRRNPLLATQIVFHKLVRWLVGILILLNLGASVVLSQLPFFRLLLVAYALFFVAAALGWSLESLGIRARSLRVPYYFVLVNLAASLGIVDFLRKRQAVTWKPARDN